MINDICRTHNVLSKKNNDLCDNQICLHVKYRYDKSHTCILNLELNSKCVEKYKLFANKVIMAKSGTIRLKFNDENKVKNPNNIGSPKIIIDLNSSSYKLIIPFHIKRNDKFDRSIYNNESVHHTYPQSNQEYYIENYGFKEDKYYLLETIDYNLLLHI